MRKSKQRKTDKRIRAKKVISDKKAIKEKKKESKLKMEAWKAATPDTWTEARKLRNEK